MPAAGINRFRRRNLNFKAHLSIVREADLDETQNEPDADGDGFNQAPVVKSGVEELEMRTWHFPSSDLPSPWFHDSDHQPHDISRSGCDGDETC